MHPGYLDSEVYVRDRDFLRNVIADSDSDREMIFTQVILVTFRGILLDICKVCVINIDIYCIHLDNKLTRTEIKYINMLRFIS